MKSDVTKHPVLAFVLGLWVLVAICLQTYGVFARNILGDSTVWLDDLQRLNFVWLIWICGALAYGGRGLIALDLVVSKFSDRPRLYHGYTLFLTFIELVFGAIFSWLAVELVLAQNRSGETTVGIAIPLWFITLGFAIGCVLIFLFAIRKSILTIRKFATAEPVEPQFTSDAASHVE